MGDRALVVFKTGGVDFSPTAYLHWSGEAVLNLLEIAIPHMRVGDVPYTLARFIGSCHVDNPGNTGLGCMSPLDSITVENMCKESHGDAGVFLVDISNPIFTVQICGGYEPTSDAHEITHATVDGHDVWYTELTRKVDS